MGDTHYEILVVGAGMAGAAAASELAGKRKVLLIEREAQPGVHSTGRSAAAFIPSYGATNSALRTLTCASKDFLATPPSDFSEQSLLTQRGLLTLFGETGCAKQEPMRTRLNALLANPIILLEGQEIAARLPALRSRWITSAWWEADVHDIDVHALHQGYLRKFQRRGGRLLTGEDFALQRDNRGWSLHTGSGAYSAEILVNAAGAWADEVAGQLDVPTLDLTPRRRTAILIKPPEGHDVRGWPLVLAHDESFYFKPDAGMVLVSPADEHPSAPCDAQAEELDVAYAAHHAEEALEGLQVRHVPHQWAGLRTFTPDRTPVIGFDPTEPTFFWNAGHGGHGIQIAPATARLVASLINAEPLPEELRSVNFDPAWVSPARLKPASSQAASGHQARLRI